MISLSVSKFLPYLFLLGAFEIASVNPECAIFQNEYVRAFALHVFYGRVLWAPPRAGPPTLSLSLRSMVVVQRVLLFSSTTTSSGERTNAYFYHYHWPPPFVRRVTLLC